VRACVCVCVCVCSHAHMLGGMFMPKSDMNVPAVSLSCLPACLAYLSVLPACLLLSSPPCIYLPDVPFLKASENFANSAH
jgi:hypothetical protein